MAVCFLRSDDTKHTMLNVSILRQTSHNSKYYSHRRTIYHKGHSLRPEVLKRIVKSIASSCDYPESIIYEPNGAEATFGFDEKVRSNAMFFLHVCI